MLPPELIYELVQLRHTELLKNATLQRLLRSNRQSYNVAQLVRQLSFRWHHWVVTVSFTHEVG